MALDFTSYINSNSDLDSLWVNETTVDSVVPAGSMYELEGFTDDIYLTAGIIWFFDDGGDYTVLSSGHPFRSGSKTFAIGPKAARVYDNAGTHKWSCHIIYKGDYKVIRGSTTATAEADTYNDTNTFYYDPSGTFADEAAGASNQYTTASALKTAIQVYNGDALIKLARGQTFTDLGGTNSWRQDTTFFDQKITFSTYGSGAKPVLNGERINFVQPGTAKFIDLDIQSGWDASTETGTKYQGIHSYLTDNKTCRILVHRCDFDGVSKALYPNNGGPGDAFVLISEVDATNWQDYGLFGTNDRIAVIGSKICQNVDALGGGDMTKAETSNNHGPYRSSGTRQVIWANEMFSNTGWFLTGGVPSHNPAFRIWSSSATDGSANIAGNVFEGGSAVASLDRSAGGGGQATPKWLRFTSNVCIASNNSYSVVSVSYGGTAIDNNVLIMPARTLNETQPFYHWIYPIFDRIDTGNLSYVDNIDPAFADPSNFTRPIHVRNNTFVFLGSAGFSESIYDRYEDNWDELVRGEDPIFPGSTWENNYTYAPDRSWSPINSGDPIDLTVFFAPRYKGLRWSGATTLDTTYATAAGSLARFAPAASSSALAAATGNVAELDFFGSIRSASTATGAYDGVLS